MLTHASLSENNCRREKLTQLLEAIHSSRQSFQNIPPRKARRVRSLVRLLTSRVNRTNG